MLYLKACPRCRGDVQFVNDVYGPFLGCLQCGFRITSGSREVMAAMTPGRPPSPAGAGERSARKRAPERDKVQAAS